MGENINRTNWHRGVIRRVWGLEFQTGRDYGAHLVTLVIVGDFRVYVVLSCVNK